MRFSVVIFLLLFLSTDVFCKIPKNYIPENPDMKQVKLISRNEVSQEVKLQNICWGWDRKDRVSEYKNTTIKLGNVKEIYYVSEKFPPEWLAAHGMLAIIMKDDSSVQCEDGRKARGVMLSVEAWRDKGVPYDIKTGLFKNFKLIYMMYTFEGRLDITCAVRKHKLELARIDINHEQKQQLLDNIITECLVDRSLVYYNSLTESCVTNCALLVNTVLEKKRQLRLWTIPKILPNIRVSMPVFLTRYFCKKKIATRCENVEVKDYNKFLAADYWPKLYQETESVLDGQTVAPALDAKLSNIKRLTDSGIFEESTERIQESKKLSLERLEELKAMQDIELIDRLIEMNLD